jgi:hypothetical protein
LTSILSAPTARHLRLQRRSETLIVESYPHSGAANSRFVSCARIFTFQWTSSLKISRNILTLPALLYSGLPQPWALPRSVKGHTGLGNAALEPLSISLISAVFCLFLWAFSWIFRNRFDPVRLGLQNIVRGQDSAGVTRGHVYVLPTALRFASFDSRRCVSLSFSATPPRNNSNGKRSWLLRLVL